MGNWAGIPESTNYTDRTAAPWYDPNKLLAAATIEMQRLIGSKKQAEYDKINAERAANPVAPMTDAQMQANYNAKVTRDPSGKGWSVKKPGSFDEFIPDYGDSAAINGILKKAGIVK